MKLSWTRPRGGFGSPFFFFKSLNIYQSINQIEKHLPQNCGLFVQIKTFEDTQPEDQIHPSASYFKPKLFPWLHAVEQIQDIPLSDCRKGFYKYG